MTSLTPDPQVTSMQPQHLGLPYPGSTPHLPPLKTGAGGGGHPHSASPGQDCTTQVGTVGTIVKHIEENHIVRLREKKLNLIYFPLLWNLNWFFKANDISSQFLLFINKPATQAANADPSPMELHQ